MSYASSSVHCIETFSSLGRLALVLLPHIPETDKRGMGVVNVWHIGGRSKWHSFQFRVRLR